MIDIKKTLEKLNISKENMGASTGNNFFGSGPRIESYSPVDGELIGSISSTTKNDYDKVILTAQEAFKFWRSYPAPKRGEIVRKYGEKLRPVSYTHLTLPTKRIV